MKRPRPRRDRGLALLLVLIAVVLIAALAIEVSQTSVTQHRVGRNAMNDLLLRTAVEGRVHILRAALKYDATSGNSIDAENEVWSGFDSDDKLSEWGERAPDALTESGSEEAVAYENTDVQILAWCEDERSKLNLLGLSRPRDTPDFKHTRDALIRLIDEYREDWSSLDLTEADAQEMVDDLVEWLEDVSEEDENPMPPVASGRGRLQSVDDLLRVNGGRWSADRLYDVADPDREAELDEDDRPRDIEARYQYREVVLRTDQGFITLLAERRNDPRFEDQSVTDEDEQDSEDGNQFERRNGVPGLFNYLTVHAESQPNAPLRININTAPEPVLRALFDVRDGDLAEAIIENRQEGAGDEDTGDAASEEEQDSGYFRNKSQLTRIDGMADNLEAYPRLDFFADTRSDVFSLRVIAWMVTGTIEGYGLDDED